MAGSIEGFSDVGMVRVKPIPVLGRDKDSAEGRKEQRSSNSGIWFPKLSHVFIWKVLRNSFVHCPYCVSYHGEVHEDVILPSSVPVAVPVKLN